ncbi:MAG: alpha-glucan family phosphorylase [Bacteroidota bacterium]
MVNKRINTDFLFETSWEVCNRFGGIHTSVSTKAEQMVSLYGDNYILLGPDILRDDSEHPEFIEDRSLFSHWQNHAAAEGLGIKIGRWKVPGDPIVILVNFSGYINQKDPIFSKFWELYGLDSLSGQWDYIEPALFGYAVGKVIENFVDFVLDPKEKAVAQFHEWLTGMGVLYLKEYKPRVATVFTNHATVLGRTMAVNNRKLYAELETIDPDTEAKKYNVLSKCSLEKLSAQYADCFTSISKIIAHESEKVLDKHPDIITPNGLNEKIMPSVEVYDSMRRENRQKLITFATELLGHSLDENVFMTATSGRYEYKNKGFDLFLKALRELNETKTGTREILAWILVPANHYGPRKDFKKKLAGEHHDEIDAPFVTHYLHYVENDPIIKQIKNSGLTNESGSKVKLIFVPAFLDGHDGIFEMKYFDFLVAQDLTIFPSYYEPWGYTAHESLAFRVPSLTTSLAGFGQWIKEHVKEPGKGLKILNRTDDNEQKVVDEIINYVKNFMQINPGEIRQMGADALGMAQTALWKDLHVNYLDACDMALKKVEERHTYAEPPKATPTKRQYKISRPVVNSPRWKRITVISNLPEKLKKLEDFLHNLWWTWDCQALELFEEIHPQLWLDCERNPIKMLDMVDFDRLRELESNEDFLQKLDSVHQRYQSYMAANNMQKPHIAYFSMEFGLHDSLKIYSGGLGILAGDYLKEASDSSINIVAIGLLYRYGYFRQLLSVLGEQIVSYDPEDFTKIPVQPVRNENGEFKTISIALPGSRLHARIWKVCIGRISLYLLDADFDANQEEDRMITHHLYGGDHENRLKQELLLGMGGIRALQALNIQPDLYHSNEGHSAFSGLERLYHLINEENLTFYEAKEIVRASTLFTTHTPVPAGHDAFTEDMLRKYISHYPGRLKISWDELMALGKANPDDPSEKFNMSFLATHLAQEVNGVSLLHGQVTREMFSNLFKGYLTEELFIGHVTNGVHYPTWTAREFRQLYRLNFGDDFESNQTNLKSWKKIYEVDDDIIWDTKMKLKQRLFKYVKQRFRDNWLKLHENPKHVIEIFDSFQEKILTIGFARRFATYKRANLLFNNPERLADIINNADRPVQFIFAGKAHPHDKAGQDLIKNIVTLSKQPDFIGKILFLQNYDMELARRLVQGVDVWLNTPTRPLEASGTSGEKAVMNGTLHFSVLDGWWVEGYQEDAGWALPKERTYEKQEFQDKLDAETIYNIIENEIAEAYYDRGKDEIPHKWVSFMKNSIANVAPKFTTTRMIHDYRDKFYTKLYARSQKVMENDYHEAKVLAEWKARISKYWYDIEVVATDILSKNSEHYQMGVDYNAEVVMNLGRLKPDEIGVELLITENFYNLIQRHEFNPVRSEGNKTYYQTRISPNKPGTFNYGLRIYPKNGLMPHRQDFGYLRWI